MPEPQEKSTKLTIVRKHKLPEWVSDEKGKQRGLRGGRWNMQRVAEFLVENPSWQTMDDLARAIYGTNSKTNRENVRKHIPPQRRFMAYSLEQPIVTQYGERGRIFRIKLYNPTDPTDRMLLRIELDRAKDNKEISEKRYETLLSLFLLQPPSLPEEGSGGVEQE